MILLIIYVHPILTHLNPLEHANTLNHIFKNLTKILPLTPFQPKPFDPLQKLHKCFLKTKSYY